MEGTYAVSMHTAGLYTVMFLSSGSLHEALVRKEGKGKGDVQWCAKQAAVIIDELDFRAAVFDVTYVDVVDGCSAVGWLHRLAWCK